MLIRYLPMATRDIDNDDRDWITAQVSNGLALLNRYGIAEPRRVSAPKIGIAVSGWRKDVAPDRPDEGNASRALGCLLGHLAVLSGFGNWVVVTDGFGTALGVQRAESEWLFHPLDVVSKRMQNEPVEEIASAYDVFVAGPPAMGR
jgi:hypothetical protein